MHCLSLALILHGLLLYEGLWCGPPATHHATAHGTTFLLTKRHHNLIFQMHQMWVSHQVKLFQVTSSYSPCSSLTRTWPTIPGQSRSLPSGECGDVCNSLATWACSEEMNDLASPPLWHAGDDQSATKVLFNFVHDLLPLQLETTNFSTGRCSSRLQCPGWFPGAAALCWAHQFALGYGAPNSWQTATASWSDSLHWLDWGRPTIRK